MNALLGIKDVLSRKRLYLTLFMVLLLSSFILILPQNLYSTVSSDSFSRYMGIGQSDLRLDIQQTENIPEKLRRLWIPWKRQPNNQVGGIDDEGFLVNEKGQGRGSIKN